MTESVKRVYADRFYREVPDVFSCPCCNSAGIEINFETNTAPIGHVICSQECGMNSLPKQEWNDFPRHSFIAHLQTQREFSLHAFGPGDRAKGIVDHIRKELIEVEAKPADVMEWVDIVLLALDGAWRAGHQPEQIWLAINEKQARNQSRIWPDWRLADPEKAIEHVRGESL